MSRVVLRRLERTKKLTGETKPWRVLGYTDYRIVHVLKTAELSN